MIGRRTVAAPVAGALWCQQGERVFGEPACTRGEESLRLTGAPVRLIDAPLTGMRGRHYSGFGDRTQTELPTCHQCIHCCVRC